MRRFLALILATLLLVSCSAPGGPPPQSVEPTAPQLEAPANSSERAAPQAEIQYMHPSEVDNSTLPITPVEELHRTGRPQEYDISTYRLVVDGLVDNTLSLSYEELLGRPQVTEEVLLICPGVFWDNALWTGTPLAPILEEAGISSGATHVRFYGGDGYTQTMPLEEVMAGGVFLAYEVNGVTLPAEHGYPIRLVVRHQYGSRWVKWLERIEVL
jgi:DMSO/TMAO reductase YedYZ molybdopterin-dependent catalytic subunit